MRVIEAVKSWETVLGQEVIIEGVAEISNSMSVIYESIDKKSIGDPITPGILVHGKQLAALVKKLPKTIPCLAGSEISYVVNVRLSGIIANTGYTFAPLKFGYIYDIEFDDKYTGVQKLSVNPRLKDIIFRVDRGLQAKEVKAFRHYFSGFKNMVELKKFLESGTDIVLINRVLETELSEHIAFLEKMNIRYVLNESPIKYGYCGMP